MPTYVSLIHWTDQGIKNYKDTTSRADDFTKLAESLGGPAHVRVYGQRPYEHDAGLQRRGDGQHHQEDRLSAVTHIRALRQACGL